jgi:hypothetical protein
MKTRFYLLVFALSLMHFSTSAQNVGIGTASPTGPLSFANQLGNKLVLWGDGTTGHYGIGVQSTFLQLYADVPNSNIVFGYGRSSGFTERVRIINSGGDGMYVNGRMIVRNGTSPLNTDFTPGIWFTNPDNTSLLGFVGTQNNQNIGFFGGPLGFGFVYDAINSRVGIGNHNPNAPLAFGPVLGKKITLYPGNLGDAGFGISGNRLQIFSDNPNADVAVGYDVAGTFVERFAFKPNGAIALNGQLGAAGQFLRSNGNAATSWSSATNDLYQRTALVNGSASILINSYVLTDVPGFNYAFNVPGNARVLVNLNAFAYAASCAFCGFSQIDLRLNLNGADVSLHRYVLTNGEDMTMTGSVLLSVGAGNHTLKLRAAISGPPVYVGTSPSIFNNNMIVQIIPE